MHQDDIGNHARYVPQQNRSNDDASPGWFDTTPTAGHNLRFPGGVPEWLKGADCKSVGLRLRWFESNLLHQSRPGLVGGEGVREGVRAGSFRAPAWCKTPLVPGSAGWAGCPKRNGDCRKGRRGRTEGGCSSMVEQKPSKLTTRVRFPSPAPRHPASEVPDRPTSFRVVISSQFQSDFQSATFRQRLRMIRPCGSVVEHSLGKGEVTRSIRVMGTRHAASPPIAARDECPAGSTRGEGPGRRGRDVGARRAAARWREAG
jgi:hypothetical protein